MFSYIFVVEEFSRDLHRKKIKIKELLHGCILNPMCENISLHRLLLAEILLK